MTASNTLITVPVLHGRLEFAVVVRQALEGVRPDCIAVELPETLSRWVLQAVARLPLLSVVSYHGAEDRPVYLPIEPADPLVEAIRFGMEHDIPVHLVDQDVDRYRRHAEHVPDPYAVKRLGHAAYCEAYDKAAHEAVDAADAGRESVMAFHLQQLLPGHQRVLFVGGMAHVRRVEALVHGSALPEPLRRVRRDGVTLYHLAAESSREVLAEMPFLQVAYEQARSARGAAEPRSGAERSAQHETEGVAALDRLDRLEQQLQLAQRARTRHEKRSGASVSATALGTMFRFARNYALVEGRLAPDLYQLLVGARGAVDDDFAHEVWDLATDWPWPGDSPGLPVLQLSIEELYEHARYIRFHRTLKTRRRNLLRLVRRRPEQRPEAWKADWSGEAICSHPPEDIVIECYGDFLRKKARGMLSAESARVEPFMASLLDGIDVRETLRNWHEGRLYVREHRVFSGDVGAVIVIFDEDTSESPRYPYCITWQGEHEQESDMALYSTPMGEQMVGPGISRCEYGGFLLTYPPGRMFHVFEDDYFDHAESKAERLLLAGIDYSVERLIVYVAAQPPRSRLKSIAERFGKKVVYIPIGDLSPLTLRRIRVFHVLDGHPVRAWAKEYV